MMTYKNIKNIVLLLWKHDLKNNNKIFPDSECNKEFLKLIKMEYFVFQGVHQPFMNIASSRDILWIPAKQKFSPRKATCSNAA